MTQPTYWSAIQVGASRDLGDCSFSVQSDSVSPILFPTALPFSHSPHGLSFSSPPPSQLSLPIMNLSLLSHGLDLVEVMKGFYFFFKTSLQRVRCFSFTSGYDLLTQMLGLVSICCICMSNHIFCSASNNNFLSTVGGDKFTCLTRFFIEYLCTVNCASVLRRVILHKV